MKITQILEEPSLHVLPSQTAGCQHADVMGGGAARLTCKAAGKEMGCTSQNTKIRCSQAHGHRGLIVTAETDDVSGTPQGHGK